MKCKSRMILALAVSVATFPLAAGTGAGEPPTPRLANHAKPFEPATSAALIPLPPGAVEPAGWLRDWCLAARDGFTGHMDEYDAEFKRAWATDHQMTGEGLLWYKGAWPYEGGGYWFDGLARLGFALHDDTLIEQARRRLCAVADPMNTDGLLFLWWLDRNNPADRQAVHAALEGWPLDAPLKLRANAVEIAWNPDPKDPRLPLLPAARRKVSESITLVPYGSTKFRISMFPVTAEPEAKASAIRRILFLGNSITLHGPKAEIGWSGNWGMAASAEDKDYVHLVAAALAERIGARPRIMVRNIADFERNYADYDVDTQLQESFAFDPDLVVLAIGENVPALDSAEAKAKFKAGVMSILRCAFARRHPLVVVRSCFWPDAAKDEVLREACQAADAIFVDAGVLGREPANAARSERSFQHDGVAAHPGDQGMRALADAILQAVLKRTPLEGS
jgi:hypothetical protein